MFFVQFLIICEVNLFLWLCAGSCIGWELRKGNKGFREFNEGIRDWGGSKGVKENWNN